MKHHHQQKRSFVSSPSSYPHVAIQPPSQPTFLNTVKEGLAMGLGSALASRAVDSFLGPRKVEIVHTSAPNRCTDFKNMIVIPEDRKEEFAECKKIGAI